MTTAEKIVKYLSKCKTPRTQAEIVRGGRLNANTVRRVLSVSPESPLNRIVLLCSGQIVVRRRKSDVWAYSLA